MNTSLKVLLILGVIATFALVSVVSDDGQYWEKNSKNCTKGSRVKGSFISDYGDKCKCDPMKIEPKLAECQRSNNSGTSTTTTTTAAPTTTTSTAAP